METATVTLGAQRVQALDRLILQHGRGSRVELLENALALLEWAITERSAGRILVSWDPVARIAREVFMPILRAFAEVPDFASTVRAQFHREPFPHVWRLDPEVGRRLQEQSFLESTRNDKEALQLRWWV